MMLSSQDRVLEFSKFQGSGNDFIIIDDLKMAFPSHNAQFIKNLCHRQLGIGADGLILIQHSSVADYKMRIFNNDGLEALMCGNGLRCLALYIYQNLKKNSKYLHIESLKGIHQCSQEGAYICTSLGSPIIKELFKELETGEFIHRIDTGVPHVVMFVQNLDREDFLETSRRIRFHKAFDPEGVNVNFACIGEDEEICVRTYERGVEEETLACGTGVSAVAVAAHAVYDLKSPVQVKVKSGEKLFCYLEKEEGVFLKILLYGIAKHVFDGKVEANELYSLANTNFHL